MEVAADREPACPRERPVWDGRVPIVRLDLDGARQRQHLVGHVELDLLETRHGTEVRVAQDEGPGGGGHRWTLRQRPSALAAAHPGAAPSAS